MTGALVRYDAACRAVAEARTADEAKDIRDKAIAMRAYARQAKNRDLEADAVEIRMRATRRLDELRRDQKETVGLAVGGQPYHQPTGFSNNPVERPTLASQGIDKNLAHQARTLGALSDDAFERAIAHARRGINTGVAMNPYAERGLDLYQTPSAAVHALLAAETITGPIWEPACGPGNIVRTLRAAGHRVIATDIGRYDCPDSLGGVDFLKQESAPAGCTTILTNPPFMHADDFVRHALRLAPRVVMLLRLAFIESVGRADILDGGQLARIFVFANRLSQIHRDGWDGPRASNPLCLAWFVWDRDHRGPTELRRISWKGDDGITTSHPLDIPAELRRTSS
jgi:hypothetical protein